MNTIDKVPQLIAASKLEKSPLNARRMPAKMGLDELKASILAHGLMQNLVVTAAKDGACRVIAGGRRLEAIRSLQAEGKLPENYAVPCQVVSEDHGVEMSLAENMVRLAMHPADQFEAFATLIDKGATAAEVAERFGVEESLVIKRMKLARVAPELIAEYRNDAISLECLMAFTLTDDCQRQLKLFESLHSWQKDNPGVIRQCLTEAMIDGSSKPARFVGVDAYVAAGGVTRADLFGDDVFFENPELLHRLVQEKLEAIRSELEAEGWGWIEINPERDWDAINRCGRIQPLLIGAPAELVDQKSMLEADLAEIEDALGETESDALLDAQENIYNRLDEVERKLATHVGFNDEHKLLAGCYVSISHDGSLCLDKGLVKPEHRKQVAQLMGTHDDEKPMPRPKHAFPESLRRDLAIYRSRAAQIEIARNPAIALNLLAFRVASAMLLEQRPVTDGPDVMFRRCIAEPVKEKEPTPAGKALEAIGQSLSAEWLTPKTEAARFEAFRLLPQEAKLNLLAYGVALTLKPKLAPDDGVHATAYDAALALTGANVADYWRPGKDGFLARINRGQLLSLARDTLGDAWALSRANEKKAVLVDHLARAFADPTEFGRTPEQVEKLKRWLPKCMAFGEPAPDSANAKKGKKAA